MVMRLLIPVFLLLTVACKMPVKETDRVAVARAGERVLYLDQIPSGLVVNGMSETDKIGRASCRETV